MIDGSLSKRKDCKSFQVLFRTCVKELPSGKLASDHSKCTERETTCESIKFTLFLMNVVSISSVCQLRCKQNVIVYCLLFSLSYCLRIINTQQLSTFRSSINLSTP